MHFSRESDGLIKKGNGRKDCHLIFYTLIFEKEFILIFRVTGDLIESSHAGQNVEIAAQEFLTSLRIYWFIKLFFIFES